VTVPSSTSAPTFELIAGEPTDRAIEALARLLLATATVNDADEASNDRDEEQHG